jgi:hypothetical protein
VDRKCIAPPQGDLDLPRHCRAGVPGATSAVKDEAAEGIPGAVDPVAGVVRAPCLHGHGLDDHGVDGRDLGLLKEVWDGDVVDYSLASESPRHIVKAYLGLSVGYTHGAVVHSVGRGQPRDGHRCQGMRELAAHEPKHQVSLVASTRNVM